MTFAAILQRREGEIVHVAPDTPVGDVVQLLADHRIGAVPVLQEGQVIGIMSERDVIYALRMQRERMRESFVPSLREYAIQYQIGPKRLGPRQILMHPGPVNRGVELSGEVVDSPQAVITMQVESGIVVRMAVLYEVLAGRAVAPAPTPEPSIA